MKASNIMSGAFLILISGGRGIRTPGTLLGHIRFPSVPLQPLEHSSNDYKSKHFNTEYIDEQIEST